MIGCRSCGGLTSASHDPPACNFFHLLPVLFIVFDMISDCEDLSSAPLLNNRFQVDDRSAPYFSPLSYKPARLAILLATGLGGFRPRLLFRVHTAAHAWRPCYIHEESRARPILSRAIKNTTICACGILSSPRNVELYNPWPWPLTVLRSVTAQPFTVTTLTTLLIVSASCLSQQQYCCLKKKHHQ